MNKRIVVPTINRMPHEKVDNLAAYYPLNSQQNLENFWKGYLKLVDLTLNNFGFSITDPNLIPDHLGLQVRNKEEFKQCHEKLLNIATLLSEEVVNDRWCNIYQFKQTPTSDDVSVPRIEIFDPMPGQNERELRSGIEHLAFQVKNYSQFVKEWMKKNSPIEYEKQIGHSTFFKTPFVNGILLEFRNDRLGE